MNALQEKFSLNHLRLVSRKQKPMNVMACYNEVWGLPAHINKHLLTDILRKEWALTGLIVSDYFAIRDVSTLHKITPSI
jgi:beta-glucosidase